MKDYHINIYFSEPDDGYVADIPDLSIYSPPVKTPAEALTAIEQAKKQWLESATAEQRPIPEPRYRSDTYNPAKQKNGGHPAEAVTEHMIQEIAGGQIVNAVIGEPEASGS